MIKNKDISVFEKHPILTYIFIFIFFIFIVELFLRVFFSDLTIIERNIQANKKVYKNYVPNSVFIRKPGINDSFDNTLNIINSIGIRGPEILPKTKYRVLNIGDSYIQADEVKFSDTFGSLLNKKFPDIEFISHGISSWSPSLEFSWIYHNMDLLKFDEVNLFLCVNDFYRKSAYRGTDQYYRDYAVYNEDGIPIEYKVKEAKQIEKNIYEKIELVRLVYFTWKFYTPKKEKNKKKRKIKPGKFVNEIILLNEDVSKWPSDLKSNVDETINVINNIKIFLDKKNIKLNVMILPLGFAWKNENIYGKMHPAYGWKKDFTIGQKGLENYLNIKLSDYNISFLDLGSAFRDAKINKPELLLYNEADGHWNAEGHKIVYKFLEKEYIK